jgi:hypothetical protein
MSRGLGKVQRAIASLVESDPDGAWTIGDLCQHVYGATDKAKRVVVLRVIRKMQLRAVRLGVPGDVLMVGEGIETCLAAMQATGHPVWAALSTSGLRTLDLPNTIRDVIVLADGDDAGEAAARDAGRHWKREGRRVRIARPSQGMDFNDLLLGRALVAEEGTR